MKIGVCVGGAVVFMVVNVGGSAGHGRRQQSVGSHGGCGSDRNRCGEVAAMEVRATMAMDAAASTAADAVSTSIDSRW